jgi:hypothetical protein
MRVHTPLCLLLLGCGPEVVLTVEGRVETVAGELLGLTSADEGAPCSARVVYRSLMGDAADVDETFGRFTLDTDDALRIDVGDVRITGSGGTQLEIWNTTGDHFHVADGVDVPQIGVDAPDMPPMRVDGRDDTKLQARIYFLDGSGKALDNDLPPRPFPFAKPRYWSLFELRRDRDWLSCQLREVVAVERER